MALYIQLSASKLFIMTKKRGDTLRFWYIMKKMASVVLMLASKLFIMTKKRDDTLRFWYIMRKMASVVLMLASNILLIIFLKAILSTNLILEIKQKIKTN